MSDEYLKLVF